MDILSFAVMPAGHYRWAAPPGAEIIDPQDETRLIEIRAVNDGNALGMVRVSRDGSRRVVLTGENGVRFAYRHQNGEVMGDRSAWDAFNETCLSG